MCVIFEDTKRICMCVSTKKMRVLWYIQCTPTWKIGARWSTNAQFLMNTATSFPVISISCSVEHRCFYRPGCKVTTSTDLRDLRIQVDSTVSVAAHVNRTCRTAYAHLRGTARTRPPLPLRACKALVLALITSRLHSRARSIQHSVATSA